MSTPDIVLRASATESGPTAVVRFEVGDAFGNVERIEFRVQVGAITKVYPPDRSPIFGVFEKEILLDPTLPTFVDPVVVLNDGSERAANEQRHEAFTTHDRKNSET